MARYIDADAVIKEIDAAQVSLESNNDAMWEINKKYYKGLCMARRIIDEQPTADFVAVVRCKDCKHKVVTSDGEYNPEDIVCDYHMSDGFDSNDFCSYGEKAAQQVVDANSAIPTPDPAASLKSEVERLEKALEVQEAEYTQALHDKAREYNMVVDKICLEHRAEYARLHEAHQEELAKAKRDIARKVIAEVDLLISKYHLEPYYSVNDMEIDIAELSKKYTKGAQK